MQPYCKLCMAPYFGENDTINEMTRYPLGTTYLGHFECDDKEACAARQAARLCSVSSGSDEEKGKER